jgi:plastocyanin
MRHMTVLLMSGVVAASLLAGCNDNPTTAPTTGGGTTTPTPTPPTPTPPAPGGGGGTTPAPVPVTAAVTVGDIFFKSGLNGSSNPAVDTVAVNGTVTWTWATGETLPHSVQSLGSPSFTSSGVQQGGGKTYQFTFTAPGSYQYNCAIHGNLMTGTIVVMAAAATSAPADSMSTPSTPPTSTPPLPGY